MYYETDCGLVFMRVTIHDVAKRAGVSPATVSRVLNERAGIRAETRERVLQAARELGYIPDFSARALATKRTHTLGFLVHARHSLSSFSFYGQVLAAAEREARRHGYHVLFVTVEDQVPTPLLHPQQVDGLILAGCDIPSDYITRLKQSRFPFVLVDNHQPGVNSIVIDNEGGAYEAVSHLIRLGHRRIGFLCEWLGDLSFSERFAGYQRALREHGLPFDSRLVAEGKPRTPGSGAIAAQRLLAQVETPPTAVFVANDLTAIEAMRAFQDHGLSIPEDLAIVGFDNGELAPLVYPPLTTVRVSRKALGEQAVRRLVDMLAHPDTPPARMTVFTQLVVRASCGHRRGSADTLPQEHAA